MRRLLGNYTCYVGTNRAHKQGLGLGGGLRFEILSREFRAGFEASH